MLYLIYDEAKLREATDNMETGISVGGRIINTVRYADKAVVANSQKGLQQLMDNLNKVTREFGMKINVKKTKVMCISRKGNSKLKIYVDGQQVDQVSQFRYLGSLISEDGYCTQEIQSRIEMAKKVFMGKKKLFTGIMNLELKKRIMKCLVWSVALYAAETWTLTQTDRRRLEAFEMWIWRRMEKISWLDKVTNEEVLKRVNEDRQILNSLWQRKHRWIGHVY